MAAYRIVTPPAVEPVDLATAKNFVRVDSDLTSDDLLIGSLISAARDLCETFTQRAFITQTWKMVMDAFPGYLDYRSGAAESVRMQSTGIWFWLGTRWGFALPFSPVQAVTSISYNDQAGVSQTLSTASYNVDLVSSPARVMPVFGQFWPLTQWAPNGVTVTFRCGYGDTSADVPAAIQTAILMQVRDWYEGRGLDVPGKGNAMSPAVEALLWQYRDVRY